jgi:hypothetical protein
MTSVLEYELEWGIERFQFDSVAKNIRRKTEKLKSATVDLRVITPSL